MYCSKIKSIKKVGKVQTYDLHTPKYHNFLLDNGILSHNSAKSEQQLKQAEDWYFYNFDRKFPSENICFSIPEAMKRLTSGDLEQGELLICEEWGVNQGSLDFQSRISKMFGYVLQAFRGLNIGLLINLPYLSMLNKQTRMLLHFNFETCGINYEEKKSYAKGFNRQVNQGTGKIYKKFFQVKHRGHWVKVSRFSYSRPSKELRQAYEKRKFEFIQKLTHDFSAELNKLDATNSAKNQRPPLTDIQTDYYKLTLQGHNQVEIGKLRSVDPSAVCRSLKSIKKKGYDVSYRKNP